MTVAGLIDSPIEMMPRTVGNHCTNPAVESRMPVQVTWTAPGVTNVELEVIAKVRVDAMLPGITSCNSNEECEDGQTCQEDLTCSE